VRNKKRIKNGKSDQKIECFSFKKRTIFAPNDLTCNIMSVLEMKVPTIGESITEVTLSQWLKKDGDYVELDEPICEFESDKATLEYPAEASGILTHVAAEGDDLEIGALVAKIDSSAQAPAQKTAPASTKEKEEEVVAPESPAVQKSGHAKGHPSPAAAKLMRENNLESSDINGTGRDGRITQEDVQKAIESKTEKPAVIQSTPSQKSPGATKQLEQKKQTHVQFSREVTSKKMSRMRRTIASRLVSAKNNSAMLTTFNEVDLTEVMALRKKYQDQFVEKYGIKLGFMSIFSKACAQVLMEMPGVNAQLDGDNLIYHDYVDISIAISTPNGLVVPPVHNVESLNYHEIELKIKELAEKAREGKLTLEEMQGGTFTITNGGIFGSMMSTPILNKPQSAILGMHTIQQRPMAIDGEVKIRPMMYLALSYDHRVIDGSSSVTFLVKVKKLLEDPITLFLGI
jgi:2-oxoglutarate dehydrogenase E2 component (dihydrolipoamide succinyltransferase)